MIPKPFSEITWLDVEALIGFREEDQNIEFKSSFKGGSDFLALSEGKQKAALESLTSEVLAFLNSQGGDVIVGVREAENEHPIAEEIIPIPNAIALADRIAQAISARIEPFQSVVRVRGIANEGGVDGVLVIRAASSLRAPHRSKDSKECYVRRGRESVPVPMDEIQDLTISRARLRSERFEFLDRHLGVLRSSHLGTIELAADRSHLRMIYMPTAFIQSEVDQALLSAVSVNDPKLYAGQREFTNDVAFRNWYGQWKPIVRGRRSSHANEYNGKQGVISREVHESGVLASDFSDNYRLGKSDNEYLGTHLSWVTGFLANSIASFRSAVKEKPILSDGLIRLGLRFPQGAKLIVGEGHWSNTYDLPEGVTAMPDYEVRSDEDWNSVFKQAQVDFCALVGLDWKPASLLPET